MDLTVVATSPTAAAALTSVTNACPGSSVTFSTTASGTGPFTHRWTKDGVPIDGLTGNSHTIGSAASGDTATYCVIVSGLCNSVTNCATLAVLSPPTISCPASITTNVCGSSVAVGFATPTVTGGGLRGCVPASGTVFAVGVNAVVCTVTNSCATNPCTFNVTVAQIAVPPVALALALQGTNVVISWPVTCTHYLLQSTPNLNAQITWQSVATAAVMIDDRYQVTRPHAAPQEFFRLFASSGLGP